MRWQGAARNRTGSEAATCFRSWSPRVVPRVRAKSHGNWTWLADEAADSQKRVAVDFRKSQPLTGGPIGIRSKSPIGRIFKPSGQSSLTRLMNSELVTQ